MQHEDGRDQGDEPGTARREDAGAVHGLLGQLRGMADRLSGLSESATSLTGLPSLPGLPLAPGSVTAEQLHAMASMLTAQRASIGAMQAQLASFDEQLAVLQKVLAPLVDWSSTWADLERRIPGLRPGS